jgi:molecular chaperone DnaK (HSP70)
VALGWGIYQKDLPAEADKPKRVVFVDLGHAALQMSACEFVKGKLTILATTHDASLGGRDFDLLIANHFIEEFKGKYKMDVTTNVRAHMTLLVECEKLKQSMSANTTELPMNIECLMDEKDVSGRMARAQVLCGVFMCVCTHNICRCACVCVCGQQFEVLAAPLLAKIEGVAQNLLVALGKQSDGKLSAADIDVIEIVGGTVRIPAVKAVLSKVFGREAQVGRELDVSHFPFFVLAHNIVATAAAQTTLILDESVAKGAALYAAIVSPNFRVRDFEIVDKTPCDINVHWTEVNKTTKMKRARFTCCCGRARATRHAIVAH